MMKHYVAGFLFSPDGASVALIEKRTPAWQRGHWNAIGGKIEPGETPAEAMAREFLEEAGLATTPGGWTPFVTLTRPDQYLVHFMFRRDPRFAQVRSMEQEKVGLHDTATLPDKLMPNLRWLIPMALDCELVFERPIAMEERPGDRTAP